MRNCKTQDAEQESTNNIRQPMHTKVHAQKSPRERQEHHDPAILRYRIEHRRCHRQIVHRMSRWKAVLVERRNFRLDLRIGRKGPRTLGRKLNALVQHKRHRHRNQRLHQNWPKAGPAQMQKNDQRKNAPNVSVAQAHVKLEELVHLRRKMPIRPIDRNPVVKLCNFLEHRGKCRFFSLRSFFKILIFFMKRRFPPVYPGLVPGRE